MKVIFLNPAITPYRKIMRDFDCAGESKGNYLYQPYDFLLMSGFVPREWDFQFIDAVAGKLSHDEVFMTLKKESPDIIVCSVAGINWVEDSGTVKSLRSLFPESKLFVFGDLFLEEHPRKEILPFVDGIFSSPVQFDFRHLLKKEFLVSEHEGFYYGKNWPLKNLKASREIKVPMPRHEAFHHKAYRWPFAKSFHYTTITTAWGCPYSCSYCILNKFPNYWRDSKEIIDELKYVKQLGYREFYMGDKSFGLPLQNVTQLLDEMIRLNLNLTWSTYFHPNQYSEKLLNKMKSAGCHTIIIGVETKDMKLLKNYGRHVREEQFQELISHARKIGMEICGDFILGLPHDDQKSIEELIDFACDLGIEYASFNVATPLPGSSLRELALTSRKISENEQQFDSSGHNNVVSFGNLSAADLKKYREMAVRRFYLRPGYLLKRLTRIRDLEHLQIQLEEGKELLKSRVRA